VLRVIKRENDVVPYSRSLSKASYILRINNAYAPNPSKPCSPNRDELRRAVEKVLRHCLR